MEQQVSLTGPDGHVFSVYSVEPDTASRGTVVVVQEIFGVNAHIRDVARGFSEAGYRAVAPALFDRAEPGIELDYDDAGRQRGRNLKATIEAADALSDIEATVGSLGKDESVAIVGYCWGGLLAWLSAARLDRLAAAVCYYGGGIAAEAGLSPRCPVQLHFGENDQSIPMDDVAQVRAAHPELPLYTYPAGHGFNCDRRASYHQESAGLARERTLAFLAAHLA